MVYFCRIGCFFRLKSYLIFFLWFLILDIEKNMDNNILFMIMDDDINLNLIFQAVEELAHPLENNVDIGERQLRPRNEDYYEVTIRRYNDVLFKEHFRMSRGTFENLLVIVGNNIDDGIPSVDLPKKILYTIWLLAKQETFLAVGDRFGLSKSTGHGIFKQVITALVNLMPQYISWPNQQNYFLSTNIFRARSRGFPGVVGAIDGCHISCKQPVNNAADFYNRKGFHSIILQEVCNERGLFIDCFIGLPGRMHDARVFRNSPLFMNIINQQNHLNLIPEGLHLIGDSAYPLMINLMTPFRDTGHLNEDQIRFNEKLSCIRSIIERSFGLLKGKFRRLKYLDIADMALGNNIIAAACILHNFIIINGDLNIMYEDIEHIEEDMEEQQPPPIAQDANEARNKRNRIVEQLR